MLILARRIGETIRINDIKITVLNIEDHKVRVGVKVPKDTTVHRQEIYLRTQKEKDALK